VFLRVRPAPRRRQIHHTEKPHVQSSQENHGNPDHGGKTAFGSIPSEMGGKIVASAVFLDFGITDAITDKHRRYPANFVIVVPAEK